MWIEHDVEYFYKGEYSERYKKLDHVGSKDHPFLDVNVVKIENGSRVDLDPILYYKETLVESQDTVRFTIYNKVLNKVIVELYVERLRKRLYWVKPNNDRVIPNFKLTLSFEQKG